MRGSLTEQDKATIYQYKLVRKIGVRQELRLSHLLAALILIAFQILMYNLQGLIAVLIGLIFVQLIQILIIRLTLVRVDEPDYRRWSWRIAPPWIGYIPTSHIELGLFRKLHRHLLWLGLCAIGIAYPWTNEAQIISLVSWHIWTLSPRLLIMRRLRKEKVNGILKLQMSDVSYYHR